MWKQDQSGTPPSALRDQSAKAASVDRQAAEKLVMDLGKSVVIKGELSGSEDLILYGQMEGSIRLPDHTLTIGPHADIKAEISAKAVVIMGAVSGNVTAGERVDIRETGAVTGNIVSPRLVIVEGGCLQGSVQMPRSADREPRKV
jgi:cytoskeletal protein CcmA (bactofilin family)